MAAAGKLEQKKRAKQVSMDIVRDGKDQSSRAKEFANNMQSDNFNKVHMFSYGMHKAGMTGEID